MYSIGIESENWLKENFKIPLDDSNSLNVLSAVAQWGFLGRVHLDSAYALLKTHCPTPVTRHRYAGMQECEFKMHRSQPSWMLVTPSPLPNNWSFGYFSY